MFPQSRISRALATLTLCLFVIVVSAAYRPAHASAVTLDPAAFVVAQGGGVAANAASEVARGETEDQVASLVITLPSIPNTTAG